MSRSIMRVRNRLVFVPACPQNQRVEHPDDRRQLEAKQEIPVPIRAHIHEFARPGDRQSHIGEPIVPKPMLETGTDLRHPYPRDHAAGKT
jgi:hypothetical protein